MARNPVQFQKGISWNEFLSLYGTEDQCFDALYRWRWPNGFVCPHCGHDRHCQLTPIVAEIGRSVITPIKPEAGSGKNPSFPRKRESRGFRDRSGFPLSRE